MANSSWSTYIKEWFSRSYVNIYRREPTDHLEMGEAQNDSTGSSTKASVPVDSKYSPKLYTYIYIMKKSAKMMPELFWCWVEGGGWKGMSWGGGLWRVSHGMAFMGYMVCHVQLCYMAWHAWNTCRGLVMSWHDMACMENMSGACHVMAWHGMHGKHVGGLSC